MARRWRPPLPKTQSQAPERSLDQRMEALRRANEIRSRRAQLLDADLQGLGPSRPTRGDGRGRGPAASIVVMQGMPALIAAARIS